MRLGSLGTIIAATGVVGYKAQNCNVTCDQINNVSVPEANSTLGNDFLPVRDSIVQTCGNSTIDFFPNCTQYYSSQYGSCTELSDLINQYNGNCQNTTSVNSSPESDNSTQPTLQPVSVPSVTNSPTSEFVLATSSAGPRSVNEEGLNDGEIAGTVIGVVGFAALATYFGIRQYNIDFGGIPQGVNENKAAISAD
ncbi:MAG: hypothetical protein VW397_08330 [Candidatus Margulisiibacteriota bacterium]